MNSKERVRAAMALEVPDRVPVMCQLALGHYMIHSGVDPMDIWFTSDGFAEALVRLADRYRFDGVLVNLLGRDPDYKKQIDRIEKKGNETVVYWKSGTYSVVPNDDLPYYFQPDGSRTFPAFAEVDPDQLYYVEPWDITGISYPYAWGFDAPRSIDDFFPPYIDDGLKEVIRRVGDRLSVHSEVFSPFAQFMELLDFQSGLMALMDDSAKCHAMLERLTAGVIDLACRQAACGVDAILISSPFAGGGFISRDMYSEFVLPYEKSLIFGVKKHYDVKMYTHTCGAIGDRLDLMYETGLNGIDTLDPPPLGTVELAEALDELKGKVFIKGNMDPVNTLLSGTPETVRAEAIDRLQTAGPGGGYILSTACSVPPRTPPEHIELLTPLAEEFGVFEG